MMLAMPLQYLTMTKVKALNCSLSVRAGVGGAYSPKGGISRSQKIGMDVPFRFPKNFFAFDFVVRGASQKTGLLAVENGQIEGTDK